MPRGSNVPVIQSNRPCQYDVSNSTTGVGSTLCVCTSVRSSNISSSVPNPPGQMITPDEYLTNMVLRTKKYRKLMPRFTHSLMPCSCGSSMPSPTDLPPAAAAPRLAASMMPGPPPVMTAMPRSAIRAPMRCAAR